MILKRNLEWKRGNGGKRVAKLPKVPDSGKRLLAFAELSGQEGLSAGAHSFKGGSFSFYDPGFLEEVKVEGSLSFSEAMLVYESTEKEGGEAFSPFDFLPLAVKYEVSYGGDGSEALITSVIELLSFSSDTIVAALRVDGFELLPSARVPLTRGLTVAELKPVKLVRPKSLWHNREGRQEAALYQMELELGYGGGELVIDVRELSVWG